VTTNQSVTGAIIMQHETVISHVMRKHLLRVQTLFTSVSIRSCYRRKAVTFCVLTISAK